MNPNEQRQAEQLDAFLTARLSGREAPAVELARDETELASELVRLAQSVEPDPAFAKHLEAQVVQAARRKQAAGGRTRMGNKEMGQGTMAAHAPRSFLPLPSTWAWLRGWTAAGLAAAAVVAAVIFMSINQTPVANAAEIVQKAQAAAHLPANNGIQSLELNETSVLRTSAGETIRSQVTRRYQAPARWRVEIQATVTGSNGQELPDRLSSSLSVTDGTNVWYLDRKKNSATIAPLAANGNGNANITSFGPQPASLSALLAQASSCFDPKLQGTDTIAGRPVYVVDLGAMKCAGAATAETGGRSLIWVDEQTFFVLKHVQYGSTGSEPLATDEVTTVRYNPSLDAALFTFTPPAGATIQDYRPKPAPAADQFQQQLEALAKQVDFPLQVPGYVPQGLSPRQPGKSSIGGIELDYVLPDEVSKPSAAILTGLLINEQKATYELVTKLTEGAKPVPLTNGRGWLRTDAPDPIGGGMDVAAYVLRDGTLVSVTSFKIAPDELVKVAGSLGTVPGSHDPLPDPTPSLLAGLRTKVSFPVSIPAEVPAGLTPEPPLGGDKPDSNVEIDYHTADGAIALVVTNALAGCCPELSAVKGEQIPLTRGADAHLIQDSDGEWALWWEQEGGLVKLSGPNMTRADLVQIANSMDKTADLGPVQAPPVRPTPAPLPAPRFTVLKPNWLPEPMTLQEDYQKAPPEFGSWAALAYLPQGANPPRTPLILFEKPKGLVTDRPADPQAKKQKIGSYEVTITGTASECWNLDWDAGDLHFSLANSYNDSGSARYTCDQLARIVASIAPAATGTPSPASSLTGGGAGQIVFYSNRGGAYNDIYLLNVGKPGVTRLTEGKAGSFSGPFSPDGTHILYTGFGLTHSYVGVMNADGSGQTNLTNLPNVDDAFPAWSPDGKRIVFTSRRDGNNEIYLMNADGSGLKRLTDNPQDDFAPAWSPDGARIAFVSDRDNQPGVYSLYLMKADGSGVTRLTRDASSDYSPDWSPDGTKIAYRSDRAGQADIYVIGVDGRGETNLTRNAANDYAPRWSPDGALIAFQTNLDGNWEIYVMNADGANPANVTNDPADDQLPFWKPGTTGGM